MEKKKKLNQKKKLKKFCLFFFSPKKFDNDKKIFLTQIMEISAKNYVFFDTTFPLFFHYLIILVF